MNYNKVIKDLKERNNTLANQYRLRDIRCINLEQENERLKKQLEDKYSKTGTLTNEVLYEENTKLINQQQEFINWLKAMSKMYEEEYKDIDIAEHYNCVLQKYKEIIGSDINVGSKGSIK